MAGRLLEAGHELWVWNRSRSKAEALGEAGAKIAASPAEAASNATVVITMLSTPDALGDVVWGRDGVAAGIAAGATLVDMSTVGPATARELERRLPDGVGIVDAPVLGSVPQAESGSLKIFAGGTKDAYDGVAEVLGILGEPSYLGPLGSGAAMKLVVNSTLGALMTGLGEAMALGDALKLDPSVVLDVLEGSPAGPMVSQKRPNIESGTFPPAFKLSLARKDMDLVVQASERAGLDPRVGRAAREWIEEADESGLGDFDYSAVVAQVRGASASLD